MTKTIISNTGLADEPTIKSSTNQTASSNDKVLLLAVSISNDKVVITPLDLEFEVDDQTSLSAAEHLLFKKLHAEFVQHQESVEKGLKALHAIFAARMPREKFASFENYCFALHGMALTEDKLTKLRAKASRLRLQGPARTEVSI